MCGEPTVNPESHQNSPALPALCPKPTVTVVIPAFNAAEFLRGGLDSVLAQTCQPLEIIVVDDGSEDGTPEVAAAYAGKVRYIRKERGGPAAARNEGIRAASGEWIAFQDADDIWPADLLEKLFAAATVTGADLIFGDSINLVEGAIVGTSRLEHSELKPRLGELVAGGVLLNPFELFLELRNFISTCAVLVRKDALTRVGLFDESLRYAEDLDLWLRLSIEHTFAPVEEAVVLRRVHATNTGRDGWAMMAAEIGVYEKLKRDARAAALRTGWRKILQRRTVPMLREQGSGYMERGEPGLARVSWAICFWETYSPVVATYWLLTFLPKSWVEALRDWKNQTRLALPISATRPDGGLK
jgi:glycosyltransferase involved in cell wall biosynthesis